MTRRTSRRRLPALAAVVVATLLWSLGAVVIASLFRDGVRPLELAQVRVYIAAIGLGTVVLWQRPRPRPRFRFRFRDVRWPMIFGLAVSVAMSTAFLLLAIEHLPVAVALVMQSFAPVLVMGWTLLSSRRRPQALAVAGVLFTLGGVALVVQLPTASLADIHPLGLLYGLAAAAGVAGLSVFGAHAAASAGAARANAMAFTMAGMGWLLVQIPHGVPALLTEPRYLAWGAAVGVFGTIAPFVLFAWGTARLGPEAGAVDISLEPVFGAIIAWAWLGQSLTVMQAAGVALVIVGVICVELGNTGLGNAEDGRGGDGENDADELKRSRPLADDDAGKTDGAERIQGHQGRHDRQVAAVDADHD